MCKFVSAGFDMLHYCHHPVVFGNINQIALTPRYWEPCMQAVCVLQQDAEGSLSRKEASVIVFDLL